MDSSNASKPCRRNRAVRDRRLGHFIGPGGEVIDKTRFLRAIESGDLTHQRMESDEWRVRAYGNSAVVTTRVITEGKYKGETFRTEERSTSVYIRQEGPWRCVLTQLTPLRSK